MPGSTELLKDKLPTKMRLPQAATTAKRFDPAYHACPLAEYASENVKFLEVVPDSAECPNVTLPSFQ